MMIKQLRTHVHVQTLCADDLIEEVGPFVELIQDAVANGASLGFVAPLLREAAQRYWLSLRDEMRAGTRLLLAARWNGRVVGTGQLAMPAWSNARHRAEVQKVIVAGSMRGRGIGQIIMGALHEAALERGRSLILLNTRHGGRPVRFYERLGYRVAGVIPGFSVDAEGRRHGTATLYQELPAPEASMHG